MTSCRCRPAKRFKDAESYCATLAHELTHWTAHPSRCARDLGKRFGDRAYAAEELIAEMGTAFLCADLGITPEVRDDHAQYLGHWLSVLKTDSRAIFTAAAHAQRAADHLHGLQPTPEPQPPDPARRREPRPARHLPHPQQFKLRCLVCARKPVDIESTGARDFLQQLDA